MGLAVQGTELPIAEKSPHRKVIEYFGNDRGFMVFLTVEKLATTQAVEHQCTGWRRGVCAVLIDQQTAQLVGGSDGIPNMELDALTTLNRTIERQRSRLP